jgi:hypothetical protein
MVFLAPAVPGTGANEASLTELCSAGNTVGALSKTTFTEFNNQVWKQLWYGHNAVDQLTELYIEIQNHSPRVRLI